MNADVRSGIKPVVVLGASGRVGNVVARQLVHAGVPIRAIARHTESLNELAEKGTDVWQGAIEDQAFMNRAFANAKAAFVLTPGDMASPDLHNEQRRNNEHIAEAIRQSDVRHVVFLSSWGAELPEKSSTIYGCYLMEQLLNAIPNLHVVHLRAVWFMDNFLFNIPLLKMAGLNGLSIDPDFAFPSIYSGDIGIVAADYLTRLTFQGQTVRYLQGPSDYSMNDVTKLLGAAIGNPSLPYVKFPAAVMINGLKSSGTISDNVARLLVETNEKINSSVVHAEPRTVQNTTGTSLEEFAQTTFTSAYKATSAPSWLKKIQGALLRFYLLTFHRPPRTTAAYPG